jgi:hypothetical protein
VEKRNACSPSTSGYGMYRNIGRGEVFLNFENSDGLRSELSPCSHHDTRSRYSIWHFRDGLIRCITKTTTTPKQSTIRYESSLSHPSLSKKCDNDESGKSTSLEHIQYHTICCHSFFCFVSFIASSKLLMSFRS